MKVELDTVDIPRLIARTKDLSYAQKGFLLEFLSLETEGQINEMIDRKGMAHTSTMSKIIESEFNDFLIDHHLKVT